MLAARQQDPESLRQHYQSVDRLVLSIDGLQPEKGHETLYVVRELTGKRVWFAEALLSATTNEVRRLIAQAKTWAHALDKPVALWITDRQDAFVTSIAAEFPDVPHRYCDNHFLRDVAKPVLAADSHAKVPMRRKVRGLRSVEQAVLKQKRPSPPESSPVEDPPAVGPIPSSDAAAGQVVLDYCQESPAVEDPLAVGPIPSINEGGGQVVLDYCQESPAVEDPPAVGSIPSIDDGGGQVVLDYCAAVRGILNDDQGGSLHPPGLRMAEALTEVRESIQKNLATKKGGSHRCNSVD